MLTLYPAGRAIWVDLVQPTPEELTRVETEFGLRVPTREQLDEIESSSRLRVEDKRLYLSMPIGAQHGLNDAAPTPVGFVLSPDLLITVRYAELQAFNNVRDSLASANTGSSSTLIFTAVLEAMIDSGADLLEKIAGALGGISRGVFRQNDLAPRRGSRLNHLLREKLTVVGDAGEHLSQIRESLMGLQRIVGFVTETAAQWLDEEVQTRLKAARQDLTSLADFQSHLSDKTQFLLDAILGFISTEQNDIFKVLTIVSVVGIPPTLIASMYGMNFHHMPELSWPWGYQYGLALIATSILVPVIWFKWRGWW